MYGYGFQYSKTDTGNIGKELANAYELRVTTALGTYENNTCLVRFLNKINFAVSIGIGTMSIGGSFIIG